MKMTKLEVDHFTSISGHFLANYISNFHKTEVLTVILKGPSCQNLTWIKSYDINKKGFLLFSFSSGNQLSHFQNGYFSKLLCVFHTRERPLMTSDFRVGRGVQMTQKIGCFRVEKGR